MHDGGPSRDRNPRGGPFAAGATQPTELARGGRVSPGPRAASAPAPSAALEPLGGPAIVAPSAPAARRVEDVIAGAAISHNFGEGRC